MRPVYVCSQPLQCSKRQLELEIGKTKLFRNGSSEQRGTRATYMSRERIWRCNSCLKCPMRRGLQR